MPNIGAIAALTEAEALADSVTAGTIPSGYASYERNVQEREDPTLTDWDRFARAEYVRLAMEEEGEFRASDNQNEIWVSQNLEVGSITQGNQKHVGVLCPLSPLAFLAHHFLIFLLS